MATAKIYYTQSSGFFKLASYVNAYKAWNFVFIMLAAVIKSFESTSSLVLEFSCVAIVVLFIFLFAIWWYFLLVSVYKYFLILLSRK